MKIKKIFILSIFVVTSASSLSAQAYQQSSYYNPFSGGLDYGKTFRGTTAGQSYFGVRIGAAFSKLKTDDFILNGGRSQVGLNVGIVRGFSLMREAPLYLETGIFYIEKGGKKREDTRKITYDLNYIEIPVMIRYGLDFYRGLSIQPMFGFYLAYGVSGKMKNFNELGAQNAFSGDYFRRFDGGLRVGMGIGYYIFSIGVTYDIGIANVCHDMIDKSRNSNIAVEFGVNF